MSFYKIFAIITLQISIYNIQHTIKISATFITLRLSLAVYLLCMRTAWFEWTVMSHQQNKIWRSEKLQLVHWPIDLCLFVTLFVCHYCLSALLDVNRQPLDFASEFSFYLLENNNYACIMPLSQSLISCLFYSQLCSLLIGWYWAIMRRKLYELTCPITLRWGL